MPDLPMWKASYCIRGCLLTHQLTKSQFFSLVGAGEIVARLKGGKTSGICNISGELLQA